MNKTSTETKLTKKILKIPFHKHLHFKKKKNYILLRSKKFSYMYLFKYYVPDLNFDKILSTLTKTY